MLNASWEEADALPALPVTFQTKKHTRVQSAGWRKPPTGQGPSAFPTSCPRSRILCAAGCVSPVNLPPSWLIPVIHPHPSLSGLGAFLARACLLMLTSVAAKECLASRRDRLRACVRECVRACACVLYPGPAVLSQSAKPDHPASATVLATHRCLWLVLSPLILLLLLLLF